MVELHEKLYQSAEIFEQNPDTIICFGPEAVPALSCEFNRLDGETVLVCTGGAGSFLKRCRRQCHRIALGIVMTGSISGP